MIQYIFKKKLIEGTIISRPNRFVMYVKIKGKILRCHCPVPGRIGDINFENIPCLLSERIDKSKITPYTVEAISLDDIQKPKKDWIGINQTKANCYIDFFLKSGELDKIIPNINSIRREVSLNNSKIDFKVNDTYIEVKTFLTVLPLRENIKTIKHSKFISYDRITRQYRDLFELILNKNKVLVILCFLYDSKRLKSPLLDLYNAPLKEIVNKSVLLGLEYWQLNLKVSQDNICVNKIYKIK